MCSGVGAARGGKWGGGRRRDGRGPGAADAAAAASPGDDMMGRARARRRGRLGRPIPVSRAHGGAARALRVPTARRQRVRLPHTDAGQVGCAYHIARNTVRATSSESREGCGSSESRAAASSETRVRLGRARPLGATHMLRSALERKGRGARDVVLCSTRGGGCCGGVSVACVVPLCSRCAMCACVPPRLRRLWEIEGVVGMIL